MRKNNIIPVAKKIPKKGNVKYIHLIKNGSKQPESATYPIIYKLIKNIKNLENASIACLNKKSKTKVHNKFDKNLFRASDIKRSCGNPKPLFDELGWEAKVDIDLIIEKMLYQSI